MLYTGSWPINYIVENYIALKCFGLRAAHVAYNSSKGLTWVGVWALIRLFRTIDGCLSHVPIPITTDIYYINLKSKLQAEGALAYGMQSGHCFGAAQWPSTPRSTPRSAPCAWDTRPWAEMGALGVG